MNKAFIFDMDGVLVDSEHAWEPVELPMLIRVLGPEVAYGIGDLIGTSIKYVYERARDLGSGVTEEDLARAYNETAMQVYSTAKITDGIERLANTLQELDYRLGLVTQSPQSWVDQVLRRLPFKNKLEVVISLRERQDLQSKPAPDGYLEAMRVLAADPKRSVILEDSNAGITSGKASGAFVIGFRGNLPPTHLLKVRADAFADTMEDVIKIVDEFSPASAPTQQ